MRASSFLSVEQGDFASCSAWRITNTANLHLTLKRGQMPIICDFAMKHLCIDSTTVVQRQLLSTYHSHFRLAEASYSAFLPLVITLVILRCPSIVPSHKVPSRVFSPTLQRCGCAPILHTPSRCSHEIVAMANLSSDWPHVKIVIVVAVSCWTYSTCQHYRIMTGED